MAAALSLGMLTFVRYLGAVAVASLLLSPASISAQTPPGTPLEARLEALQRELLALKSAVRVEGTDDSATLTARVEELSTQLKILARQIELDKEQAAERAKTSPQTTAGRGGFSVQSADGQFRVRVRGYLHSDARFFVDDTANRAVDTFVLRRVRPIVEATMFGIFDFRVMPDFGSGATVLQDAYVDMRFHPKLKVRVGKFKPPLGLERLMSATEIPFVERGLPTALVPNRDMGVMVHGDLASGNLAYAAGVFNGVIDGGSADSDIQDGKDVVARLFAQPFRTRRDSRWQGLGLGVAGSYGSQRGVSAASNALPTFRTAGQTSFFAFRGDDPVLGAVLADGTHTRFSTQGYYYVGSFGFLGEHVISSQEIRRGTTADTLDKSAWQVAGSWVVTGEPATHRSVVPRAGFDLAANTWGALELTTRYTALDIDADAFPFFANPVSAASGAQAWTAGVNWYLNTGVKLQANFERTTFDTAGATRREAENTVFTRIQFAF